MGNFVRRQAGDMAMEVIDSGKKKPVLGSVAPMKRSDMAAYLARAYGADGAYIIIVNVDKGGGLRVRTGQHNLSERDARDVLGMAISLSYACDTVVVENTTSAVTDESDLV